MGTDAVGRSGTGPPPLPPLTEPLWIPHSLAQLGGLDDVRSRELHRRFENLVAFAAMARSGFTGRHFGGRSSFSTGAALPPISDRRRRSIQHIGESLPIAPLLGRAVEVETGPSSGDPRQRISSLDRSVGAALPSSR